MLYGLRAGPAGRRQPEFGAWNLALTTELRSESGDGMYKYDSTSGQPSITTEGAEEQ